LVRLQRPARLGRSAVALHLASGSSLKAPRRTLEQSLAHVKTKRAPRRATRILASSHRMGVLLDRGGRATLRVKAGLLAWWHPARVREPQPPRDWIPQRRGGSAWGGAHLAGRWLIAINLVSREPTLWDRDDSDALAGKRDLAPEIIGPERRKRLSVGAVKGGTEAVVVHLETVRVGRHTRSPTPLRADSGAWPVGHKPHPGHDVHKGCRPGRAQSMRRDVASRGLWPRVTWTTHSRSSGVSNRPQRRSRNRDPLRPAWTSGART